MTRKWFSLDVRGTTKEWTFSVWAEDEFWQEWVNDGVHIDQLVNTVPKRVVDLGLTKLWIWLQDHHILPLFW